MAGGVFGGGNGTVVNPYVVEDAADLNAVRNILNAHYLQTADIDLALMGDWEKIGTNLEGERFAGVYDGGNYAISNLRIRDLSPTPRAGLFCFIEGVVKNVHLRNVDVDCSVERNTPRYVVTLDLWPIAFTGTFRLGFPRTGSPDLTDHLPLYASDEEIRQAIEALDSITGMVIVTSNTSGVASQKRWFIQYSSEQGPGNMYVLSHITDGIGNPHMTTSTVTWTESPEDPYRFAGVRVGALAGACTGLVENCSVVGGTVKGSYIVGGLLASVSGTVKRCYTNVTTIANYVSTSWSHSSWAGWSIFSRAGVDVGGLIGSALSGCSMDNCYSRGSVSSTFTTHILPHVMRNVAGFVGQANPNAHFLNCYSTCAVLSARAQARGFAGNNTDRGEPGSASTPHPNMAYCYFDKDISGREDNDGWGIPRMTAQMTFPFDEVTTYLNWHFETIWTILAGENDGYPFFAGVSAYVDFAGMLPIHTSMDASLGLLVSLSGTINSQSHWFTKRMLQIWAKRNGVYGPVKGYVKHNGVYKPITDMYRKVDGVYKE